jgi:ATP-dependent DNA helicase RecQ
MVNGYIDLAQIKAISVLSKIMESEKPCYIMMESMIALTNMFRSLDEAGITFCIINNNLLNRYINPTNLDIPDFESSDFQEEEKNNIYAPYYSYCEHIGNKQWINYIEPDFTNTHCVNNIDLFPSLELNDLEEQPSDASISTLTTDDGTLQIILEKIFNGETLANSDYAIPKNTQSNALYGVLQYIIKELCLPIKLYWISNPKEEKKVRNELYDELKNVWGYDSFRQLRMYKDLDFGRETINVSQGTVIETVVSQCESALKGEPYKNILLTSPTGAGKSLLFQLSAIYLAKKYQALTLIVSPLLALMEDQVNNLLPLYPSVATLNSNKSATESADILRKVQNGTISMLYLAPELLLSHSLQSIIGERHLGLVVIDEAHTVTTWGRDFRVDYWFLGDYLRASKKYIDYGFPIFALTATAVWDVTRKNDMVFETIASLNMNPCIKYIGVVRRDNINFEIGRPKRVTDYEKQRQKRTVECIKDAYNKNKKTIVYFPYVSTINHILDDPELQSIRHKITVFHSQLTPIQKQTNANNFKIGICPIMCASKAFGMGVDVNDITEVYHHAPTGNLSDYVQEIGRLARDEKLTGIAKIDFNEQDFKYTRQLHGLSTIKPYQLEQVLKKLMELFVMRGEKRNMMISPIDFEYIFPDAKDQLDQKFKSSLLLISNDLMHHLHFRSLIVRAKNMFANVYIQLPKDEFVGFEQDYSKYVRIVDRENYRFVLYGERYWNEKCSNISFAEFKNKLMNQQIFRKNHVKPINRLEVQLNTGVNVDNCLSLLQRFLMKSEMILDNIANAKAGEPRHIKYKEINKTLSDSGYSQIECSEFIHSFILAYATPSCITDKSVFCQVKIKENEDDNQISLLTHGYESVKSSMLIAYKQHIVQENVNIYCEPDEPIIRLAELLNSLGLATFQRKGGCDPQVFVRINNPNYLRDLVSKGNYKNGMLMDIYQKYRISEQVFTYFFNTDMTDKQRWDFIESYFLGSSIEDLKNQKHEHLFRSAN